MRQDDGHMSEKTGRSGPRAPATGRARLEPPDISERGGQKGGQPQRSDERLFMQLTAYGECRDVGAVSGQLAEAGIDGVLYEDLNDARGIALLALNRDPNFFIDTLRPLLNTGACATLTRKPELTLFGRTYALGYEPDLEDALFARPRRTVFNPAWRWAVWYPLRRSGAFARLPVDEQRVILAEHGEIGIRFGAADYAHDVRLACHGLDTNDNDFVIGLIGKELYPLSALVQVMRGTQQTALYLDRLGPFFVGRAVWQAASAVRP
jgi:Chlorite dismutase